MIKLADRLLKKGKGKLLFFAASLAKLLIITGSFYLLSRFRSDSIVYFIQGLSVIIDIPPALRRQWIDRVELPDLDPAVLEGVRLFFRSIAHGA